MWTRTRIWTYSMAVVASAAVFIGWMYSVEMDGQTRDEIGLASVVGFALVEWPVIAAMAFILMFLPWFLAIRVGDGLRRTGSARLAVGASVAVFIGAAMLVVVAVLALSLGRGAGVEQSFLDMLTHATAAHGLALLASGATGGLTYWLVARRNSRRAV